MRFLSVRQAFRAIPHKQFRGLRAWHEDCVTAFEPAPCRAVFHPLPQPNVMTYQDTRISELTYLFRIVQMIHEADSIDKVHRMLLSLCTCGTVIGCRRAILFTVDARNGVIRGDMGIERDAAGAADRNGISSFEEMAREVFDGFERIESGDLTLLARTVAVPLDWHRSALVKAARSGFPVLAEGRLGECTADPFFSSFGAESYIAVPIREDDPDASKAEHDAPSAAGAILAADGPKEGERIDVGRISLLYSLAQQASLAVSGLKQRAESDRRFRTLSKSIEAIERAGSEVQLADAVRQAMTMICRALKGTGAILKDFTANKTVFVKTVHEYSLSSGGLDEETAHCLDAVLERTAGLVRPMQGDAGHALLGSVEHIAGFVACPLVVRNDVVGALAVYAEKKGHAEHGRKRFSAKDAAFLEIGAGILAAAIGSRNASERLRRNEDFLAEIRSNLGREREKSRLGDKGIEYAEKMREALDRMKQLLPLDTRSEAAISELASLVGEAEKHTNHYLDGAAPAKSRLTNVDVFAMTGAIAESWRKEYEGRGIEVSINVPAQGPRLLMEKKNIASALDNILRSTGSALATGDKLRIEGCVGDGCIKIMLADTGAGLPGDVLSRLFMPFRDVQLEDERKNALSLAGEIISLHGGGIELKTSSGWKTMLVVSFREAANKERRRSAAERRRRSRDRRMTVKNS